MISYVTNEYDVRSWYNFLNSARKTTVDQVKSRPLERSVSGSNTWFNGVLGMFEAHQHTCGLQPSWSSTVRPEKADAFSGRQSRQGKSQSPVTWMAGWRETETLKPIDQAIGRMVRESPGRNASERRGGPERPEIRRPSLTVERRRQHGSAHLAEATSHFGGVRATAR